MDEEFLEDAEVSTQDRDLVLSEWANRHEDDGITILETREISGEDTSTGLETDQEVVVGDLEAAIDSIEASHAALNVHLTDTFHRNDVMTIDAMAVGLKGTALENQTWTTWRRFLRRLARKSSMTWLNVTKIW